MKLILGIIGLCLTTWLPAQEVLITRFQPGNYLADNLHLVELRCPGRNRVNVEGYLLVTRDYSVRLPKGAVVSASKPFVIGKMNSGDRPLDFELNSAPDFLIRFHLMETEGNYVALINRNGKMVDGFYYSPQPNVPFLPERDTSITFDRERLPFFLPPENRPIWGYLDARDDPNNEFERVQGKWTLKNASSTSEPTDITDLTLRYFDGIVTVKWASAFEKGVESYAIERSIDQKTFEQIGEVKAVGLSTEFNYYAFYDKNIELGRDYFYRIRSITEGEREMFSKLSSVRIEEGLEEFSMEVIVAPHSDGAELNLRFISAYSQEIRIKLLDERMSEVAILFQDYVTADQPNLLKVARRLPSGTYLVLASTETRRFGKEFVVK